MKNRFFGHDWCEGFSLVEALIAIAIAALLAVALTRVVGNTRMNAAKIRQLVEVMTLNETLLDQIRAPKSGQTEGRTGELAWRAIVEPIDFTVVAGHMVDRRPGERPSPAKGVGFVTEVDKPSDKVSASPKTSEWIPFHVTVVVGSQSGRRYTSDTIAIGPATSDQ